MFFVQIGEAGRNPYLQRKIGKEGYKSDVGFHLVADRFNGPTNRLNVVPGNGKRLKDGLPNLNQGPYKQFENDIFELASKNPGKVELKIELRYNHGNISARPDVIYGSYRLSGSNEWIKKSFINKF